MSNNYFRFLMASILALGLFGSAAHGQGTDNRYAPWRFGLNLGLNYNLAGVGFANWETDRSLDGRFIPFVANDGYGFGPYFGIMAEYVSQSWWGLSLRASYDVRDLTAYDDQSFLKPGTNEFFKDEFKFSNQYLALEPSAAHTTDGRPRFPHHVGPYVALGNKYNV